jgi:hypothetical protein
VLQNAEELIVTDILTGELGLALLDVQEHIVEDVKDEVLLLRQHLLADADQECAEEYTLSDIHSTFMISPKQRLDFASRRRIVAAWTPLSMKNYRLNRVVSTNTLGMNSRIELILFIQFLQISCADSGMLAPYSSLTDN